MSRHELDVLPDEFKAIRNGTKGFTVRKGGHYQTGDTVVLHEWVPTGNPDGGRYTGRSLERRVGHTAKGGKAFALRPGWVVLSIAEAAPTPIPTQSLEQHGATLIHRLTQCWAREFAKSGDFSEMVPEIDKLLGELREQGWEGSKLYLYLKMWALQAVPEWLDSPLDPALEADMNSLLEA